MSDYPLLPISDIRVRYATYDGCGSCGEDAEVSEWLLAVFDKALAAHDAEREAAIRADERERVGRDALVAAALHEPWHDECDGPVTDCCECGQKYPCRTARSLRLVYVDGVLSPISGEALAALGDAAREDGGQWWKGVPHELCVCGYMKFVGHICTKCGRTAATRRDGNHA